MESFMNKLVMLRIVHHLRGANSKCAQLIFDQLARKTSTFNIPWFHYRVYKSPLLDAF